MSCTKPIFIAILLLLGASAHGAAPAEQPDPALKERLIRALAAGAGFNDRFEAEVWLVDMSNRLSERVSDRHRRLELLKSIHSEASRVRLPPELVLSVIEVESNFDRFALSEAGAQGLMQVMPFWLREIGRAGDNLFDTLTNLRMGCTILRYYLDMENGNLVRALARYNGSAGSYKYPNKVLDAFQRRWRRD